MFFPTSISLYHFCWPGPEAIQLLGADDVLSVSRMDAQPNGAFKSVCSGINTARFLFMLFWIMMQELSFVKRNSSEFWHDCIIDQQWCSGFRYF